MSRLGIRGRMRWGGEMLSQLLVAALKDHLPALCLLAE